MEVIKLAHYGNLPLPEYNMMSAGLDLRAAIYDPIILKPGDETVIPTGLQIYIGSEQLPFHFLGIYGMIAPRSGLGYKHYLRLANTVGVIDEDYQGEIMLKIRNESVDSELTIERGDRLCQIIFQPYIRGIEFEEVDKFGDTDRGEGGFGHTGVK